MGDNKGKTFKNFIESNKKITQANNNFIGENVIRDYTYKFSEILKCFDIDNEYLKFNGEYQVFHEDEDFIVKIIEEDFKKEYIKNIRKEKFIKIDIECIKEIIQGLVSMLSKTVKDEELLNEQINKIYKKTRIRVREKSNEVEGLMETISSNIKEFYSDDLFQLQNDETIILQLTELQNDLQNSYERFTNTMKNSFQNQMEEVLKDIRKINNKNHVENLNDMETLKNNLEVNRSINYLLNNDKEYTKLKKELNEAYDNDKTKNLKQREINKISHELDNIRSFYEKKVFNMNNEELENLKKISSDIKSYLRKE